MPGAASTARRRAEPVAAVVEPGWLSPASAAAFLGISRSRFFRLLSTTPIPRYRLGYRTIRFRRRDLVSLMAARREPTS